MGTHLEERVAALERELGRSRRFNRRLTSAIGLTVATLLLVAWSPTDQDNIKARSIYLVDSKGTERAKLYAGDDAAGLVLYDATHKPTVALDSFANGPALTLFDSNGKRRVRTTVYKGDPSMEFLRPNEQAFFRIP